MKKQRLWAIRLTLMPTLAVNLLSGLSWALAPEAVMPGFEVEGIGGRVLVQAFGISLALSTMPYVAAWSNPYRHLLSFVYVLLFQLLGTLAEIVVITTLPPGHEVLRTTGKLFITVDGAGFLLLLVGFVLTWQGRGKRV
ncbi:MAG: hypothetical protein H5T64_02515 [Chloroflexi bacterium]|nr:hypothetical protein [Chloroflexota bacterium]